jgi:hypothetical protein
VKTFAAGLALALAIGTGAGTADAASPRKSTCKLTAPPASVAAGMSVPFAGKVSPKAARKVVLQERAGRRWLTRGKGKSSKKGAFSLAARMDQPGTSKWRVTAAKTSKYKSATCSSATVTVTSGTGTGSDGMMGGDMTGTPGPGSEAPSSPPAGGHKPGNSFRAIYAVASDEIAVADRPAAILTDIEAANGWFGTQTNGNVQPRWTHGADGAPVVTTVNLPNPTSYYNGPDAFDHVRSDVLAAAPPAAATEKTVVWIEGGTMVQGCGITGSDVSVLFGAVCGIHPSAGDRWPYGGTYLLGHEMTHNFGAVQSCAPHEGAGAHVTDDPRDVLYQGPQPRDWNNQMLDPGHDDYYATGRADCPGIESSPFWTMTSDPGS